MVSLMMRQGCRTQVAVKWLFSWPSGAIWVAGAHSRGVLVGVRKQAQSPIVRATPKSNSVDNVRALQGDATVLEKAIKL